MMDDRERMRRCYFHEELDRPGIRCPKLYPPDDSSYDPLKSYLETNTAYRAHWNSTLLDSPLPIEIREQPVDDHWKRMVAVLHTPKGDLYASDLVSLTGEPGMPETYFVKSREDAEKYLSLPLPTVRGNLTSFFELEKTVGNRGIVDVRLSTNPGGFAADLCGSEIFAELTITDRDIIHALCERQMTILINRLKYILAAGIGPYFSTLGHEMIVPPLHGPDDFREFICKYDMPVIDMIHDCDGRIYVHCHGSIGTVMQEFLDMGVDVLHPFEPPPMGDITAKQAKQITRDRMCLEGNIQISDFYDLTPDEIREQTLQLIEDAFDDHKGLIVSPSASPYMRGRGQDCFEQYKAMVETVIHYKS